jgi:hypothetical protein
MEVNMIMPDEDTIVRARQKAIRREIDRREIAIKAIQYDGGWKCPSTVLSWFPAAEDKDPQIMSMAGFYRLISRKALPVELLSVMLPDGFRIVRVPEEVDHDEIATVLHDYLQTKERAHHPESPDGREISSCEDADLSGKVVSFQAKSA